MTKVLVNCIRPFLSRISRALQGSFIPGRDTLDNIIMAQEVFNWMHKTHTKKGATAFKLYLEKAYDRVEQSFLKATLQFGFPFDDYLAYYALCKIFSAFYSLE